MSMVLKAGTTDVSVVIRILDSTDGTPETGVTSATGGLALEYRREGAASVGLTESDLAALTTAHTDGGMKHIGNGYYRVDLPDAACAAGVTGVLVHGTATGMVVQGQYIQLVAYDPFDAVRMGMSALPNASPAASGGLPTVNASNFIAGIQGTITTLDALDTAQDTQHATTRTDIATAQADLDVITGVDGVTLATAQGNYAPAVAGDAMDLITNAVDAAALAADAGTEIGNAVWASTTRVLTASTNFNDLSTADVDARLAAIGLDHLVSAAVAGADVADNSIVAKLVSSAATADWDTFVNTTDSMQALRDRGDAAWITATTVDLNADQSGVTIGTVNALGTQAKLDVNAEVDAALDTVISTPTPGSALDVLDGLNTVLPASGTLAVAGDGMDVTAVNGVAADAVKLQRAVSTNVTGAVVTDGANTTDTFETDLSGPTDFIKGLVLKFENGTLAGQGGVITAFNTTTKFVTVEAGSFTTTPTGGDDFTVA